jgi:hypothetical protein
MPRTRSGHVHTSFCVGTVNIRYAEKRAEKDLSQRTTGRGTRCEFDLQPTR